MRVFVPLILVASFVHASAAAARSLVSEGWAGAAELAHTAREGACEQINEAEALGALARDRNCRTDVHQVGFRDVADLTRKLNASSEDAFFAALASRHAGELTCGADFANQVSAGEQTALADIAGKVAAARDARQAWIKAVKDLHAGRGGGDQMCPTTVGELDHSEYANPTRNATCERLIKARAAFAMAQSSVPLIGEQHVADFVKKYTEGADEASPADLNAALAKTFGAAATELRAQSETLKSRASQKGGGDFGLEERRTLLSDPLVTANVTALNPSALKAVECRAEARFGKGAELRDSVVKIGTLALTAAALPLKGVSLAAGALRGVQAARAVGQLSLNAARVLGASAAVGALGTGATEAAKACFTIPAKGSACVSAPKVERLQAETCALAASLAGLDATGVVPGAALAKFFSLGLGAKKAAGAVEALKVDAQVGFRTSSGKARAGEVLELKRGADGKVDSALVRWRDPETGAFKQKVVPASELSRPLAGKNLALKGDEAVDQFRRGFNDDLFTLENRYVSYSDARGGRRAARVVGRRGEGLEVETIAGAGLERKVLSPSEVESARVSSTAAGPEFFAAYNHALFDKQPAFRAEAGRTLNQRVFIDSSGPRQVQVVNDHSYRQTTVARGDIVEHHAPGRVPPGEYTWALVEDGTIVTGRVHDNFEFGVKHTHLADGRRLLVAGEMKVPDAARGFDYNIESGTYTRSLIEKYHLNADELTAKAGRALSLMMGAEGTPTTRTFWFGRSPDVRAVRSYCLDRAFAAFNAQLCGGAGLSH